jgi:hypothetical protein
MKLSGENRSTRGKTCPSATSSTKNPTWTDPGSNPSLRGEKPATNRLSHGTALQGVSIYIYLVSSIMLSTSCICFASTICCRPL